MSDLPLIVLSSRSTRDNLLMVLPIDAITAWQASLPTQMFRTHQSRASGRLANLDGREIQHKALGPRSMKSRVFMISDRAAPRSLPFTRWYLRYPSP
jgi:hypothetical protein